MVTNRSVSKTGVERICCWFVKILLLLKICTLSNFILSLSESDRSDTELEESKAGNEFRFFRESRIIDESILLYDRICVILYCPRLRLLKTPCEANLFKSRKVYRLLPMKSVRAVIQVVPKDGILHVDNEGSPRQTRAGQASERTEKREPNLFFVIHLLKLTFEKFAM